MTVVNEASAATTTGEPNNSNIENPETQANKSTSITATTYASLFQLFQDQDYDQVEEILSQHAELALETTTRLQQYHIDSSIRKSYSLLHLLTSVSSTPHSLLELVATQNPTAITQTESQYGDTPLHYIGRSHSLFSATKLKTLLDLIPDKQKDRIAIRNSFGGTVLHSAANHNAILAALQALVTAYPPLLSIVTTHQRAHAVTTLWHSYISTIQGHMCVAELLKTQNQQKLDVTELPLHFQRFWQKCQYLALEHYRRQVTASDTTIEPRHLLHALLRCHVPVRLLQIALLILPSISATSSADEMSVLPLHWILEHRPYNMTDDEMSLIRAVITAFPTACSCVPSTTTAFGQQQHQRRLPLHIAIASMIPWSHGIDLLVQHCPDAVQARIHVLNDKGKDEWWLPFQLAALVGGSNNKAQQLDTVFCLLRERPDLLLSV